MERDRWERKKERKHTMRQLAAHHLKSDKFTATSMQQLTLEHSMLSESLQEVQSSVTATSMQTEPVLPQVPMPSSDFTSSPTVVNDEDSDSGATVLHMKSKITNAVINKDARGAAQIAAQTATAEIIKYNRISEMLPQKSHMKRLSKMVCLDNDSSSYNRDDSLDANYYIFQENIPLSLRPNGDKVRIYEYGNIY